MPPGSTFTSVIIIINSSITIDNNNVIIIIVINTFSVCVYIYIYIYIYIIQLPARGEPCEAFDLASGSLGAVGKQKEVGSSQRGV